MTAKKRINTLINHNKKVADSICKNNITVKPYDLKKSLLYFFKIFDSKILFHENPLLSQL